MIEHPGTRPSGEGFPNLQRGWAPIADKKLRAETQRYGLGETADDTLPPEGWQPLASTLTPNRTWPGTSEPTYPRPLEWEPSSTIPGYEVREDGKLRPARTASPDIDLSVVPDDEGLYVDDRPTLEIDMDDVIDAELVEPEHDPSRVAPTTEQDDDDIIDAEIVDDTRVLDVVEPETTVTDGVEDDNYDDTPETNLVDVEADEATVAVDALSAAVSPVDMAGNEVPTSGIRQRLYDRMAAKKDRLGMAYMTGDLTNMGWRRYTRRDAHEPNPNRAIVEFQSAEKWQQRTANIEPVTVTSLRKKIAILHADRLDKSAGRDREAAKALLTSDTADHAAHFGGETPDGSVIEAQAAAREKRADKKSQRAEKIRARLAGKITKEKPVKVIQFVRNTMPSTEPATEAESAIPELNDTPETEQLTTSPDTVAAEPTPTTTEAESNPLLGYAFASHEDIDEAEASDPVFRLRSHEVFNQLFSDGSELSQEYEAIEASHANGELSEEDYDQATNQLALKARRVAATTAKITPGAR